MPFKLFEFPEQFMICGFLITLTQLDKTGSIDKVFIPLEIIHVFLGHFQFSIWRALFTPLSADEFQLNSKSAYIPQCINQQDLYKSLHYVHYSLSGFIQPFCFVGLVETAGESTILL